MVSLKSFLKVCAPLLALAVATILAAAFVRGIAYDETPDDPLAHVAGTFMLMDQMA